MEKSKKTELGRKGEEEAMLFLRQEAKLKIRHRNWFSGHRELDIVAEDDNFIVFIEVKTRTSEEIEDPKEAVTINKQKNIICAAEAYYEEFDIEKDSRFDIVSVLIRDNKAIIEHTEDAFTPLW